MSSSGFLNSCKLLILGTWLKLVKGRRGLSPSLGDLRLTILES